MITTAAVATAAASITSGTPSLRGPYLDLTTGKANMLAFARMNANLDETKVKYGSASGVVSGVRPGEPVRDLFAFEVVSTARAWKQPDGSYRALHRETVLYTDAQSGEVLSEYLNPYTNERVKVVHVVNDPWNESFEEFESRPPSYGGLNKNTDAPRTPLSVRWREIPGGLVIAERHIQLFYPSALQPDKWTRESGGKMNQVSEYLTYILPLKDMQDQRKTSLEHSGTWSRVAPWLLMDADGPGAGTHPVRIARVVVRSHRPAQAQGAGLHAEGTARDADTSAQGVVVEAEPVEPRGVRAGAEAGTAETVKDHDRSLSGGRCRAAGRSTAPVPHWP